MFTELTDRVRAAHGDAWQAEGRLREPFGGGALEIAGARLSASGLPEPKWNNADIVSSDVDRGVLQTWYAAKGVPWGIRVPVGLTFDLGSPLFVKRCAGLLAGAFDAMPAVAEVTVRRATRDDLPIYADIELARFGGDHDLEYRWLGPAIGARGFTHWLAESANVSVGVAMTIRTDDRAGPAVYLAGIATVPSWSGRGLEKLLASRAAAAAFDADATLVHMNPDDDEATWALELGFVEVPGFVVSVVESGRGAGAAPRRTGRRRSPRR